jgi:hypothetical protein
VLDATDVLAILDELDRAGLVAWLDGGWGVDALLGEHTRPHQDLDLAIARDDLAAVEAASAGLPARMVLSGRRPHRRGRGRRPAGRCLTPELQVRNHLGYPLDATDRHDLVLLTERFGSRCHRASGRDVRNAAGPCPSVSSRSSRRSSTAPSPLPGGGRSG